MAGFSADIKEDLFDTIFHKLVVLMFTVVSAKYLNLPITKPKMVYNKQ